MDTMTFHYIKFVGFYIIFNDARRSTVHALRLN